MRIGEPDAVGRAQVERMQLAIVHEEGKLLALGLGVGGGRQTGSHDHAGDGAVAEFQFHARALELVQQAAQRLGIGDAEGECFQSVAQWVHGIVAQAGNLAAAALLDGERLQHVVHVGRVEFQSRRFAGREPPRAFKEANAVLVEDHLGDRKVRGGERSRAG